MREPPGLVPDLVLRGGEVVTVDRDFSVAEAVAVHAGSIVAVGGDDEVSALSGRRTRVVDLHGRCVVPGQIDNHVHFLLAGLGLDPGGRGKVRIDTLRSVEEILTAIKQRADATPEGGWISTSPMYRGELRERRFPTRDDLDRVTPRHPAYIFQSGKNIIANSYALRLAGIDRTTLDPLEPEGRIVRDDAGEPTGHLIAGAADMARLAWWRRAGQPPKKWDFLYYDPGVMLAALLAQQEVFHACGVTGVRDMGASPDEVDTYVEAHRRGLLKVRTDVLLGLPTRYWSTDEIAAALDHYFVPKQHIGDDMLRIGGVKLVVVNDQWWAYGRDKLDFLIDELNQRGYTLAVHVQTGGCDEANDAVLSALERTSLANPVAGRRFSVEHGLGLNRPDDYRRVRDLGIVVSQCALLAYYGAARSLHMHQALERVGVAKASESDGWRRTVRDWGLPIRSWLDAGLVVTSGSDVPAIPYDTERPFLAQYCALTGDTLVGPLLDGQGITRQQMLRMHTIDAAYTSWQERRRGSIEVGKLADLVVLDRDVLTCPDREVADIQVLATYLGGELVFER